MKLVLFSNSVLAWLASGALASPHAAGDEFSSATQVRPWTQALLQQQSPNDLGNRSIPPVLPPVESGTSPIRFDDARNGLSGTGSYGASILPVQSQIDHRPSATTSFAPVQQCEYLRQPSCPPPAPTRGTAWQKGAWQITPYGFLAGELIASDASITARPFVLYVNDDVGVREPQFTPHGQTTALGFQFEGPAVGPFQSGGNILFSFLGGQPVLNQSTPFLLRAYGDLKNEDWRFGFGVAPDIFGPQTPRTVNFGGHIQAGNIAAFRGQMRVDRFFQLADNVRWTCMGALSQQVVNDFSSDPLAIGTDNGWPNIEGRLLLAFGQSKAAEAPLQLGVSGVIGETRALRITGTNVSTTWGVSTDGQMKNGRFGARYELFAGQAIGTYNAAIGQSLNPENGEPITAVGGFVEGWCNLHDSVSWHVGYGVDDPNNGDLGRTVDPAIGPVAGQRSRNSVGWTSLFWNVTEAFELGFEVSTRETDYIAPSISNSAMVYHFRSRLIF